MCKSTGKEDRDPFFQVEMREAFITKVTQSATDEGNVLQKVEMVFKSISIQYYQQGLDSKQPGRPPGRSTSSPGTSRRARPSRDRAR